MRIAATKAAFLSFQIDRMERHGVVAVHDEDPQSTINRRNVMVEAAMVAWAEEDSKRRVQKVC